MMFLKEYFSIDIEQITADWKQSCPKERIGFPFAMSGVIDCFSAFSVEPNHRCSDITNGAIFAKIVAVSS